MVARLARLLPTPGVPHLRATRHRRRESRPREGMQGGRDADDDGGVDTEGLARALLRARDRLLDIEARLHQARGVAEETAR